MAGISKPKLEARLDVATLHRRTFVARVPAFTHRASSRAKNEIREFDTLSKSIQVLNVCDYGNKVMPQGTCVGVGAVIIDVADSLFDQTASITPSYKFSVHAL